MVQAFVEAPHPERETHALDQVVLRLHERFPRLSVDQVTEVVQEHYRRFDDSAIRDFVPIFVERNAREDLLAQP